MSMLILDNGHEIDWEGVKIVDQETVDIIRKVKESIHYQTPASNPCLIDFQ